MQCEEVRSYCERVIIIVVNIYVTSPVDVVSAAAKVGRLARAEVDRGICYGGPEVSPSENFGKYRRKSVKFGAFLATAATENVQLCVPLRFCGSV